MHLRHVLSTKSSPEELYTIAPESPVRDLAMLMGEKDIGVVLVLREEEPDKVLGIVTERDILRSCCRLHRTMDQLRAEDVMTREVVFGNPQDSVVDALRTMHHHSVRYLPIREGDRVIGMVSIGDVLRALYDEDEMHLRHMGEYLSGTYHSSVF
jgi:CBS domain-containing protein